MPRSSETMEGIPLRVPLTLANNEYEQALPEGTRYFTIQCLSDFDVRFAFESGKVAGPTGHYATLRSGYVYNSPEKLSLGPNSRTLYLASSEAGVVVQILYWY